MLSLRSLSHTFQARLAIGQAFHSINGMLAANTTGLALNAITNDNVGSASGICFDTAGAAWADAPEPAGADAASALISSTEALRKRSSSSRSTGSWAGSYSSTRLAQS